MDILSLIIYTYTSIQQKLQLFRIFCIYEIQSSSPNYIFFE